MPREAHGRSLLRNGPARSSKRKPQRSTALNALQTAERQIPDSTKIVQHRLGEIEEDPYDHKSRADPDGRSNKRRKISDTQVEEDDVEEGSDLEGGMWHTGVNEDEDSDLDSEEAFGESDEDKFADFAFRGSAAGPSRKKSLNNKPANEIDLDEDLDHLSEDNDLEIEEDDLGDEAVDLTTAWDLDNASVSEKRQRNSKKFVSKVGKQAMNSLNSLNSLDIPSNNDGSDSESETTEDESQFSLSDDEVDGDPSGLRTFVENLSSSDVKIRNKPLSPDVKPANGRPSRFGIAASKISAADLLQYIKDPIQRQSLKMLSGSERSDAEVYKGGVPGKLSAPLAKRQQDKLDRGAAYEKSKETLNRWIDTVKQNRRADHLSFPVDDSANESLLGQKQLMPTTLSLPTTELEATISEIMRESGMDHTKNQSTEDQEQAFENLAMRNMDFEAVRAKRAELRMTRELMFREEVRARRIKKIKSKAFRRVHRKERDRVEAQRQEALIAAGLLNSDEEREKQDRRRAEERMGARHRESKWAKAVKEAGRTKWDDDARVAVTDLAVRDEELRRRISGKPIANTDGSDIDSESDSDLDTDDDGKQLNAKISALESSGSAIGRSKLSQMAFMQRAEAVQKADNEEQIRQLRLAMDETTNDLSDRENDAELSGRQRYGTQKSTKPQSKNRLSVNEFEAYLSDDANADVDADNTSAHAKDSRDKRTIHPRNIESVDRKQTDKSKWHTAGQLKLSIDHNIQHSAKPLFSKGKQAEEFVMGDYTSDSESQTEPEIQREQNPEQVKAALAAAIFAGPNDAAHEFAKEKADLVEEEGDQVIDSTLPGWGNWAGAGISKRELKNSKGRFTTVVKGIAPEKRQDARLDRVIINEKRTKKNGRYLANELPYPYENRQQYERSLRLPIGPEWSTTNHYQNSIKPRVLLKQGTVIRPIAKPVT